MLKPVVRQLMRSALNGRRSALVLQNPDDVALFKQARSSMTTQSGSSRARAWTARASPPGTERRRRSSAPLRVVLAARLLWDKGIAEYVEAARELKAKAAR